MKANAKTSPPFFFFLLKVFCNVFVTLIPPKSLVLVHLLGSKHVLSTCWVHGPRFSARGHEEHCSTMEEPTVSWGRDTLRHIFGPAW
jgi:hypothetical protein